MTKPVGPVCNLACRYCFYLDNATALAAGRAGCMAPEVLERYIRERIAADPGPEVLFAWQGGEPTLAGLDFFREVVRLQREHGDGRPITNTLQTNATRLTPEWARFLAENRFLVGVSLDGPPRLHDAMRPHRDGRGSAAEVLAGLRLLKRHGVEFNTLTVIGRHNVRYPLEVYGYLTGLGARHLQFIPLVERRLPAAGARDRAHAMPPPPDAPVVGEASPESVPAAAFGGFLVAIFDHWSQRDIGRVFVQTFESAIGAWLGHGPTLCVHAPTCGRGLALERDGSLYACDHYVDEPFRLGRLGMQSLAEIVDSPAQQAFGEAKRASLPPSCRACPWLFACGGDCPKHRFATDADGTPGLSWLCPSYRRFFAHADPYLRALIAELVPPQDGGFARGGLPRQKGIYLIKV